jgi:DNA-binding MarR family transcriptional regulator
MASERHPRDLIRKIHLLLRRQCDAELQPYGLSFSQFAVLRAVALHPDATLTELAGCSGMSKQAVHQALRGLRAASLVTAANADVGLGQPIELVAAGQQLLTTATDVVDRVEEHMLADITPEDRRTLTMLLRGCIDNLEALHPPHATTRRSACPPGDDALEEFLDEDDLELPGNPTTS